MVLFTSGILLRERESEREREREREYQNSDAWLSKAEITIKMKF